MNTSDFLKDIELSRFLGYEKLKNFVLNEHFLHADKVKGGYSFTLSSDTKEIFEIDTAKGYIRMTARYKDNNTGYVHVEDEGEQISENLKKDLQKIARGNSAPENGLYKLQEVANILKVSRQTIYNYIAADKLRATKYGKEYRVTEEDLQEFIKTGRNA